MAKRSVFHCFVNTQAELVIWIQQNTLRFATIRLKWKTAFSSCIFVQNMFITLQISDDFWKDIMHCDVISCVIYLLNKVQYLEKEESSRNFTKEVMLSL